MEQFPYAAIIGQEQAKTALLLNCIMPQIGGVLLAGEKGTGKSTLVRSLTQICPERKVLTIPLSVTEDMLLGSLNVETAVAKGTFEYESGLLAKADGHILYVDEVNLLSDSAINLLLDAASSGKCTVEREGVSHSFPCRIILVGSMNPEEGALRPQILDRFGFYVELKASVNKRERVEIMKNRLLYEADPIGFYNRFTDQNKAVESKLRTALSKLAKTKTSDETLTMVAEICHKAFVAGHRADIALLLGAIANSALNNRTLVSRFDIATVEPLALAHRIRSINAPEENPDDEPAENENEEQEQDNAASQNNNQPENNQEHSNNQQKSENSEDQPPLEAPANVGDELFDFDPFFALNGDPLKPSSDKMKRIKGSGKRNKTASGTKRGRYVKSKIPAGKLTDLAFDATLRTAAPYQILREKNGLALSIHSCDIREKIRERRVGNTVLFLVDASGSMGIRQRMSEAKTAVLEMLKQSYIKRDSVGLMTFRHDETETVLPPTRSVNLAHKLLKDIRTGGRTPLSSALKDAHLLMQSLRRKNNEIMPVIVLFTDGRETVQNAQADGAIPAAKQICNDNVRLIVIDTESGFIRLGKAKSLAQQSEAEYYTIDELNEKNVCEVVR